MANSPVFKRTSQIVQSIVLLSLSIIGCGGGGMGGDILDLPLAKEAIITITTKGYFTDLIGQVQVEEIDITPADDESVISDYAVYWAFGPGLIHSQHQKPIIIFPATGQTHNFRFAQGSLSPLGVWGIVVCSREPGGLKDCGTGEAGNKNSYPFMAGLNLNTVIHTTLPVVNDLVSAVANSGQCPGYNIVTTCGNNVCDANESESNCARDCAEFSIQSYNSMNLCTETRDESTYYPTSVGEIQQIINNARASGQHVRAVSGAVPLENGKVMGKIGGATSFACTDGVVIGMDNITPENANFPIYIENFEGKEVVHAPAGMRLSALGEWLYERGRGLGYVHMGWADVSLGGNISTSAHGSSGKNRSVLAQSIVAMDVVGADGVLRTYSAGSTDTDTFKALRTGIGYLGVIVNVKLEVRPAMNLHSKVTFHDESELFEGAGAGWHAAIADCDWGQFIWFPGLKKFMKMCAMETNAPAEPGAQNRLLNPIVPTFFSKPFEQIFQAGACKSDSGIIELLEMFRFTQLALISPLSKEVNGELLPSRDVIGPQYKMQSAHANNTTLDVNQLDYEIAVPMTYMPQAAVYTHEFMNGQNSKNRKIVLPLNGIFARFGIAEDNTLMAYTGAGGPWIDGEPVGYFEVTNYVPIGWSEEATAEYLELTVEYVTHLIINFAGRSHWTKSRDWVFELEQSLGNTNYDGRFDRFNAVVGQLDPTGVFANPMAKRFGITYPQFEYPANW